MPRLSKIGAAALGAFGWTSGSAVTASYLVVAGGGASNGDAQASGGGGAGGLLTGTTSLNPTLSYTITVGAGATASTSTGTNSPGSDSSISSVGITASGGGAGGAGANGGVKNGGNGGSGGGGGSSNAAGTSSGGTAVSGQGNAGGTGTGSVTNTSRASGGGGGAGAAGSNGSSNVGGNGGVGVSSSISGTATFYAGGGGGGGQGTGGSGGNGGGGNGGGGNGSRGVAGTANRGGGGGAGYEDSAAYNGIANGGSGIVIISYVGAQQFGGGVVTSSGGNTIHTFTTSGTLSPLSSLTASYLIVAGGGGGGAENGGGGGAGGFRTGSGITLDTNSIYVVTVGAGGNGGVNDQGSNGSNSVFLNLTSTGGGGGGKYSGTNAGRDGGSGGGSASAGTAGSGNTPSTSPSQGNNGGVGRTGSPYYGGGGGGASAVGTAGTSGGNGGAGTASSISGSSVTYAGGGGGGSISGGSSGGAGGGGAGAASSSKVTGTAGTANLGGGGGGGSDANGDGGAGGSGVVIISYPGSTQQMAGGTVTVAGGNVIHTFTSSGYLTPIVLVTNSLRFRSSATAYLSRTMRTPTTQNTWTYSAWVKRGALGIYANLLSDTNDSLNTQFLFYTDNTLGFYYSGTDIFTTSQVFRDPSAWYHIVLSVNSSASGTNKVNLYVNGSQVTSFSTDNRSSFSTSLINTSGSTNLIGAYGSTRANLFDGYLTEINFIDGQQLTPNSFGTFNGLGVWQPIRYGGSYGTNGFYLPFNYNGTTSTYGGSFNGSSQYLTIAQNAAFNMGSGDFTLESWVYFNASGRAAIISQINSAGTNSSCSFYFERNASNFLRIIVASGGTGYEVTGTTVVPSGQWIHVAGVRNGNNLSCYLNGVSQGTVDVTGVSLNSSTENVQINGYGTSTGLVFAGAMSNTRIVKGTAVYTSNFTPPTANLTAISGTSLLTLQNATIVDNSTNAFTITNTGTVVTYVGYPFYLNIAKDQSPNGNNWTPNAVNNGLPSSSTYDVMTDVPTLTSATTANYCVMNPLSFFATGASALDGNLTLSITTAGGNIRPTFGATTGKFYAEFTINNIGGATGTQFSVLTTTPSTTATSLMTAIYYVNGQTYNYASASFVSYGASYTTGDIIGVAWDCDAFSVTFYKNNVSQGTLSGAAINANAAGQGVAPIGASSGSPSSISVACNYGQQPFTYTPPTGFVALNTFNLPTPTIGATASTTANKYMDASLWTGNGASSQVVTNSGSMQPDFVWIKSRNQAFGHLLFDSVRGISLYLQSNGTGAEVTDANMVSSLNSNGFTVGSSGFTNGNTYTQVGWQWRASNATAVTNTNGSIISTVSANTTSGFSIVTYTGTGANATVGHGLGVAPSMYIVKRRNAGGDNWAVYHVSTGNTQFLRLDTTNAAQTFNLWQNTTPTSSVFYLTSDVGVNGSGSTYVAYCFAQVAGYSAMGSYVGNDSADGTFIYTGFRPAFVLYKKATGTDGWLIYDSKRNSYNVADALLQPNTSGAEAVSAPGSIDIVSNGFKQRNANNIGNSSSFTYIYMAFAESPFKYANAR